jgi:hypothetical protein
MATESQVVHALDMVVHGGPARTAKRKARAAGIESATRLETADRAADLKRVIGSKNVVGVGVAEKVRNGRSTGELALTFYVLKKVKDKKKLRGDEVVPPAVPLPLTRGKAVATDVVELGPLRLEAGAIQSGSSIGRADEDKAGTLGAIVTNGKDHFLLSNSHVIGKNGRAKGGKIVSPGRADGGRLSDAIGELKRTARWQLGGEFANNVDAALATLDRTRFEHLRTVVRGLGAVRGITRARRRMKVVKVGRTTGRTTGTVMDTNFHFTFKYPRVGLIGYSNQILVSRFTDSGDSGSLVLDAKTKKAVGLHFAGAPTGSVSNPIDAVLRHLGVKLAASKGKGGARKGGKRKRRSGSGKAP